MILAFNPYWFYFLLIIGLMISYIVITIIINHCKEKIIKEEIEAYCKRSGFKYELSQDKRYDIEISSNEFSMQLKLCKIPSNSSVTINSKSTWCLRFGGGNRKGRNYPNKRYLNELIPFLNSKCSEKTIKVVVFCPSTEVILKYLNESEITEVKPSDTSYGIKAIPYSMLIEKFDELIGNKKKQ